MALPVSGIISLSDLVAEYGGTLSGGLFDYYRGGSRVSTTKAIAGTWGSQLYQPFAGSAKYYVRGSSYVWNGSSVSQYSSGWQYGKGSSQGGGDYAIRRRTYTTVAANTGVPTSGVIGLFDFYGQGN